MKGVVAGILVAVVLVLVGAAAFVSSGRYNVAADQPHWAVTERVLGMARDRSIESAARSIEVPALDRPEMISRGARQYAEMCAGCHLSPVSRDSDTRNGLNPRPPDLYRNPIEPRRAFWVTKHGLKMSGMPAWGRSHDDAAIWSLVAFLQKMPELDAQGYRALAAVPGETSGARRESRASHH